MHQLCFWNIFVINGGFKTSKLLVLKLTTIIKHGIWAYKKNLQTVNFKIRQDEFKNDMKQDINYRTYETYEEEIPAQKCQFSIQPFEDTLVCNYHTSQQKPLEYPITNEH